MDIWDDCIYDMLLHHAPVKTRVHSVQDPWSTVQYSIVQYSTVSTAYVKLDTGHYQALNIGYATTQAPSCHHWKPHMPPLQHPTCHHSNTHTPPLQTPTCHHSSYQKLVVWRRRRRRRKESLSEDPWFHLCGLWVKKI